MKDDIPVSSPAAATNARTTRRQFITKTCAATVGSALAAGTSPAQAAGAGRTLRLGVIGCGSRGTGAAANALKADPDTKIVAMADMFADKMEGSVKRLEHIGGERFAVEEERRFLGFEGYKKLLESGVDVVILATPPHFRPLHLAAAVEAGVHVFVEKPVAVDAPGARAVLATCEEAKRKGLSIVSGLMLRYGKAVGETMRRIHGGEIGKIVTMQSNYNIGGLWLHPRQPGWSDMEWQLRNWYYFTWLSGDHIVEQHVHGLDLMAWAMEGEYPSQCFALGGRQARTGPEYGHIFDHHAVAYEYAGGQRCFSFCRQQTGADQDTAQLVFGQKGIADLTRKTVTAGEVWRYSRARGDGGSDVPYEEEHRVLFKSIREGEAVNNGDYMVKSTMMAIMGRMASYTGKKITWEEAWESKEDLTPAAYEFGPMPVPEVAVPGKTAFS